MGSSPFFLDDYLTPEDAESGIDYNDPLGVNKYRQSIPKPPKPSPVDYFLRATSLDEINHDTQLTGDAWNQVKQIGSGFGNALAAVPKFMFGAPKAGLDIAASELTGQEGIKSTGDILAEHLPRTGFLPTPDRILNPESTDDTRSKIERGLVRSVGNLATDPMAYASLGTSGIPGALLSGYFAGQGIGSGIEQGYKGITEKDPEQITEALVSGLMGLAAAKHGISEAGSVPVSEKNPNITWEKSEGPLPEISVKSGLADIGEALNPLKSGLESQTGVFDPTGKTIAASKYQDSLRAKYGSGWLAKTTELEKKILSNLQGGTGKVIRKGDVPSESTIEPNLKVESGKVPEISEYKAPYEDLESELKGFDDWKNSPELANVKESILKSQPVAESAQVGEPISVEPLPEDFTPPAAKVKPGTNQVQEPLTDERLAAIRQELDDRVAKQAERIARARATEKTKTQAAEEVSNRKAKIRSLDNPTEKSLLNDITDLPKTLRASIDISYPLRQGLFLMNRPEALAGMAKGTKSLVSHENHLAIHEELANRPNASLYDKFGLNQIKYDPTEVASGNEQFPSEMAQKIPGVKQSERAYTDASNLSRANMFDAFAEKFQKAGKTPESRPDLYTGMAKYLNVLTGRDPLPKKLQDAGWLLNKVFWSPMYVKSRMQLLNPVFYAKLPREMKTEAVRDVGGTLAVLGVALAGIKAAAGDKAEIETDPRHTNFGKVKVGHTSYDMFTGLLPLIRTASRIATGEIKTPKGNYAMKGGGIFADKTDTLKQMPFGGRSIAGEVSSFGEGKLSPVISAIKSKSSGVGYGGEKYDWPEFLRDTTLPMAPVDIVSAWKNWDRTEGLKALPTILGVNVNTDLPDSELVKPKSTSSTAAKKRKVVKINW